MSDRIFEIHQQWQSGFSRVYSNSCCSCLFKPEIIKISQSSHLSFTLWLFYTRVMFEHLLRDTLRNACARFRGRQWCKLRVVTLSKLFFLAIREEKIPLWLGYSSAISKARTTIKMSMWNTKNWNILKECKNTEFSRVYDSFKCPYEKSLETYRMHLVFTQPFRHELDVTKGHL